MKKNRIKIWAVVVVVVLLLVVVVAYWLLWPSVQLAQRSGG